MVLKETYANDGLIRLNKFVSRITEDFCNLFYYYYPNTRCDTFIHYYRMDLLSRAVTAFSPGYRAGTTIPGLKVPPLIPGHRAGTKEGPLVPVDVTNRD